ncbi:MAG: HPr family phosphocarrier protein [Acidobacteria bacterium]|nr:HPr family phosphocarrier protein [Acidobacteriota bacterium]
MSRGEVVVVNRLGLHARAAARFVQLAGQFRSTVRVAVGERVMDGKSILGLLLLAAAQGTPLRIETEGADADAALAALIELVERGFEETTG